MNYYSLNNQARDASFKDALINGIAPDKGLYFPSQISRLDDSFFRHIEYFSDKEIAFHVIKQFIGDEIDEKSIKSIIEETLCFDFPMVKIEENKSALELFHGPTMAFKDVGARFMARCLGHFKKQDKSLKEVTVLVATSGDTGGAVANGFLGVEGVRVVILYPSGKVSEVQEKQLTTLGQNITALEVDGTFDDCQAMVKSAFIDESLQNHLKLTSANSINIARWLPQMFYFFFAFKQLKNKHKELVFSVPSGNFGNICAGLMAYRLGLPVKKFIASTNINATVPEFLESGNYNPKPSFQTISNAMDVGDPSNFVRILELFNKDSSALKEVFDSYSFSDLETKEMMLHLYKDFHYTADPHGAVGYLGLEKYGLKDKEHGVFLETAHPIKFLDVVEPVIKQEIAYPKQISELLDKEKKAIGISDYDGLKNYLLNSSIK